MLDFLRLLVLRADLTLELLDFLFELFVVLSGHGDFVLVLIFNRFQPQDFFLLIFKLLLNPGELSLGIHRARRTPLTLRCILQSRQSLPRKIVHLRLKLSNQAIFLSKLISQLFDKFIVSCVHYQLGRCGVRLYVHLLLLSCLIFGQRRQNVIRVTADLIVRRAHRILLLLNFLLFLARSLCDVVAKIALSVREEVCLRGRLESVVCIVLVVDCRLALILS